MDDRSIINLIYGRWDYVCSIFNRCINTIDIYHELDVLKWRSFENALGITESEFMEMDQDEKNLVILKYFIPIKGEAPTRFGELLRALVYILSNPDGNYVHKSILYISHILSGDDTKYYNFKNALDTILGSIHMECIKSDLFKAHLSRTELLNAVKYFINELIHTILGNNLYDYIHYKDISYRKYDDTLNYYLGAISYLDGVPIDLSR